MNKYKKKPIVVEAMQYDGINIEEIIIKLGVPEYGCDLISDDVTIPTLEGEMTVKVNDWIIKGINGEFYPCKPDIFEKTYERVEE